MIPIMDIPQGLELKKCIKWLIRETMDRKKQKILRSNPYLHCEYSEVEERLIPSKSRLNHQQLMDIYLLGNEAWYLYDITNFITLSNCSKRTFKSNLPLISEPRYRYFEINLKALEEGDIISLGLATKYFNDNLMLGQQNYSIGLNINTSKLYYKNYVDGIDISFQQDIYHEDSTIGCGLDYQNELFFSYEQKMFKTGIIIDYEVFPAFSFFNPFKKKKNTSININFGAQPYNLLDANYYQMCMVARNNWSYAMNFQLPSPSYNSIQSDLLWLSSDLHA